MKRKETLLLIILILALFEKRFGLMGGDVMLILSSFLIVLNYIFEIIKLTINYKLYSLKNVVITNLLSLFLILSIIGIVFLHQWWYFPFWDYIYRIIWPLLFIIFIVFFARVMVLKINTNKESVIVFFFNKNLKLLIVILVVSILSFVTPLDTFCLIFKPYKYEDIHLRFENTRSMREGIHPINW